MGRQTAGYPIPEGEKGWVKTRLARVGERVSEVKRLAQEANLAAARVRSDLNPEISVRVAQGTTAQRDARYGVPSTDAARVALANQRVVWWNSELGWEESYYAVTGLAGLTVPGLIAGTASGWYPIGRGPIGTLHAASGGQSRSANQVYEAWQDFGTGDSHRNAGAAFLSRDVHKLVMGIPGRWRIVAGLFVPNGSGTGVVSLRVYNSAATALKIIQKPAPLLASFGQFIEWEFPNMPVPAAAYATLYVDATPGGAWTIGGSNGYLLVEYLGPALPTA